jgi:hypothetical protein
LRSERPRSTFVFALLISATLFAVAPLARQGVPNSPSGRPSEEAIARALETVKADPNLAGSRTIKMLRWNDRKAAAKRQTPSWLAWLGNFFRWVEQSARLLIWAGAAVLAAFLVVYTLRILRAARADAGADVFTAPTHVRDLDIRPEMLPDNIGQAARALWDRGEHRAALALLYRGLLSRLAHVHRLQIRDSTTEGDCLALAGTHLTEQRRAYTAQLVRVWQRAVYGGEDASSSAVYGLCDDFAGALDAPPAAEATGGGAES